MNPYEPKTSIETTLDYIQRDIKDIKETLERRYVTRDEFQPIKSLVYGLVGTILFGVLGAIAKLLIVK